MCLRQRRHFFRVQPLLRAIAEGQEARRLEAGGLGLKQAADRCLDITKRPGSGRGASPRVRGEIGPSDGRSIVGETTAWGPTKGTLLGIELTHKLHRMQFGQV